MRKKETYRTTHEKWQMKEAIRLLETDGEMIKGREHFHLFRHYKQIMRLTLARTIAIAKTTIFPAHPSPSRFLQKCSVYASSLFPRKNLKNPANLKSFYSSIHPN
ncbi:hypothetical protein L1887_20351 [Cichorium endivia]|nr:hypothetical protein L1887_20351 [Cichorium endivia]